MKKFLTLFLVVYCKLLSAQISVISYQQNLSFINSSTAFNSSVLNNASTSIQVKIICEVISGANLVCKFNANEITLKSGLNNLNSGNVFLKNVEYGNVFAAKHLRESGRLPFGKYRICLKIIPTSIDFDGDEFCDILEVESITNLNLQYPIDEDMVYTTTPVLLWNHDALFGDNSGPCSYRLIIVEKEHGQSADVAIRANTPIWINENLKSHMIPFPVMHPKPLQYGHSYAWKVMELCEGKVLNESETWYFTIHKDTLPEAIKYAELSSKEDLGFYYAKGSKVYFKFNDRYSANSPLTYFVKSGSQKVYDFEIGEEGKDKINYLKKGEGDNRYELNLENSGLNAGIYTLVVRDESNELFYLKFVIE